MNIPKPWAIAILLLLTASLAGNLFAGGMLLGRKFGQPEAPAVGQLVRAFFETVPQDARPVVRRHFLAKAPAILGKVREIAQARRHVADLLSQPTLDETALASAFAEIRARTTELQEIAQNTLLSALKELPAEARAEWQVRWRDGGLPLGQFRRE